MIDADSKLAVKLQQEERDSLKRSRKSSKSVSKPTKKKRKSNNENPNSFHKKNVGLSPALQEFLGQEEMPRTQVVKAVWEYIKEKDLQNPEDRREIICDEAMKPIFGDKMTMFSMNKILSKHLYNLDDVVPNSSRTEGEREERHEEEPPNEVGKKSVIAS